MMVFAVMVAVLAIAFPILLKVSIKAGRDLASKMVQKWIGLQYGERLKHDLIYKEAFSKEADRIFVRETFRRAISILVWASECLILTVSLLVLNVASNLVVDEVRRKIITLVCVMMLLLMVLFIAISFAAIVIEMDDADVAGRRARLDELGGRNG